MIAPNLTVRPGDRLDEYELEEVVATSGMATVFRARDVRNGRQVAIKMPHPEVESDPTMFDRFRREEEIGTRIEHPGVMKVFANPGRSQVYMVMEWLDGRLLREILNERKKLPVERAVKLTVGICEALEHVHAHGVVHRDLKPENIMVSEDDEIHLIDFGIAGSVGARRLTFAHFSQSMGTPDYISPEQVRGKRGDARSDIYAMGVMLYEMLTGVVPFSGANPFAVMNDRLLNQPVPPSELEPSVTPQLQEIVYRAMEREPKNRYAHAREMAHDLLHQDEVGVAARPDAEQWKTRRSPERRRVLLYFALALIPIALFGLLLLMARHR
jgi:eukaryotic-like serine/threonine-protein kinase